MSLSTPTRSRSRLLALAAWAALFTSLPGPSAALPVAAAQPAAGEVLDTGLYATAGGEVLPITKAVVAGEDRLLFERNGETLTREMLEKLEAESPLPVVDEELLRSAAAGPADRPLELVVWLARRPGARIAPTRRASPSPTPGTPTSSAAWRRWSRCPSPTAAECPPSTPRSPSPRLRA